MMLLTTFSRINNVKNIRSLHQLYCTNYLHASASICTPNQSAISNLNKNLKLKRPHYATKSVNIPCRLLQSSVPLSQRHTTQAEKNRSTFYYLAGIGILVVGLSYAAVPLYRIFCQAYSYGGTTQHDVEGEKVVGMTPRKDRKIRIYFNADTAAAMAWNFKPQQRKLELVPGETALAFYTAKNPTDRQVIGVSTYNVLPFDAGQYFNKIQCFCFEEQMLNPHEEVHMPVFFYIDPEFADDPAMEEVESITLSYTFFEAKPGLEIPLPGFMQNKS